MNCRYTLKNKKEILNSRIDSTQILNKAILECKNPPKHFINSSTATIYIHSIDKQMDEYTGETGDDFSMTVAKKWESTFFETKTPSTLKTAIRTAIVLGKSGGAFVPLKRISQLGLGGKQGSGKQWVSWIHEKDFARAVSFIIQNKLSGVINITAPQPIKNVDFMNALCNQLKMPVRIPSPEILLEAGAKVIGTETELLLKSRNVIPKRLLENGFVHQFHTIEQAFQELLS